MVPVQIDRYVVYPRQEPKVFVGEYAAHAPTNRLGFEGVLLTLVYGCIVAGLAA
jgi:hypothetical protein